jgi:tetratricopeptide (TPR) repeat protein
MIFFMRLFIIIGFVFGLSACVSEAPKATKQEVPDEKIGSSVIQKVTKAIEQEPNNALLYFERSKAYFADEKYTVAISDVDRAIALDSTETSYYLHRGNIHFKKNVTRYSKENWEKCKSLDLEETECRMKLAELYYTVGDLESALLNVNEVLDIVKNKPEMLLLKGLCYRNMDKPEKAHQYFQEAIDEKPDYSRAIEMQALLYAFENNPLAVAYYQRAISIAPNSSDLYHNLAVFYKNQGDFERAMGAYQQCILVNPQSKESYYALGYMYLEMEEVLKAKDFFAQAIDISTDYPQAYFALGYCYELLNELPNAEANYRAALSIRGDYAAARDGLTRISALRKD